MKTLKKNIKLFIGLIIGTILASSITVYAYSLYANQIEYKKEGTSIANVEEAINDLYNKTTYEKTLLWSNSNPNVNFAEQNITLNQSANNFSHILLCWKDYPSSTEIYENIYKISPWHNTYFGDTASGTSMYARELILNNTTIWFSTGRHVWGGGSSEGLIIPCEIYGLKL